MANIKKTSKKAAPASKKAPGRPAKAKAAAKTTAKSAKTKAAKPAAKAAKTVKGKPTAIVANTVKGKGVSFMENQCGWHGKAPNDEEFEIALKDLEVSE